MCFSWIQSWWLLRYFMELQWRRAAAFYFNKIIDLDSFFSVFQIGVWPLQDSQVCLAALIISSSVIHVLPRPPLLKSAPFSLNKRSACEYTVLHGRLHVTLFALLVVSATAGNDSVKGKWDFVSRSRSSGFSCWLWELLAGNLSERLTQLRFKTAIWIHLCRLLWAQLRNMEHVQRKDRLLTQVNTLLICSSSPQESKQPLRLECCVFAAQRCV